MNEFTLETPMKEVEGRFPFSRSLLHAKFHVGGCATCGYEPDESVAAVAAKHGKDAEAMVEALNTGLGEMNSCEISVKDTAELLKARAADTFLVDVREPWEFDLAHIKGSTLLSEGNMDVVFEKAKSASDVVVVCHHGMRSLNATLFFRQNGMAQARSLRGGIDAWSREVDSSIPRY